MQPIRAVAQAVATTVVAVVIGLGAQGQSRVAPPGISSVAPSAPTRSVSAQMLTVTGVRFQSGLSLEVVAPGGEKLSYAGSAIQTPRETSFQVAIVLAASGAFTLTVTNPDGARSEPFVLKSEPSTVTPRIDRVLPDQLAKNPQPQVLTISGDHFVQGLSVSLTDPIGEVSVFTGSATGAVSAVSFDVSVVLGLSGEYTVMVTNPFGESSNTVALNVATRTARR